MMRRIVRAILEFVLPLQSLRLIGLALAYGTLLALCILLAYELRFDFDVPERWQDSMATVCGLTVCVHLLSLFVFRQFDGLLSYFSTPDLRKVVLACATTVLVVGSLREVFGVEWGPPRGVLLTYFVLSIGALSALRVSFRHLRMMTHVGRMLPHPKAQPVGIVGAGDCGAALAMDLLNKPWLALKPVAFFDDHRQTHCSIHGIPVLGRPEEIAALQDRLHLKEVIIAMPSAPAKRIRDVLQLIRAVGLPCRTVPSLDQLATGLLSVSNLRPVPIHHLLGREPVQIEGEAVRQEIEGRTVMVTGAGGSIGSELCRQILAFEPDTLVLIERSEPQLFVIEQELRAAAAGTSILPVVGDITRRARMREVFHRFRPAVVFHAAAHKHVPMMESQPGEAIRNNVLGTALLADLAIEYGVDRFVLVSTDKAVNPTNVMGATKRLAEMYVQAMTTRNTATKFMAVRFGNVLGSSGSVVPTFERQIAEGGPVTVTHPEVTRFFMTIPEAVSLVLQSSTLGRGGDIFILDMGKPVKILDLAMQMIALSGLTPHEDIEIRFTGMRPGEKLYEELSHGGERVTPTAHPKITRLISPPLHHTYIAAFLERLSGVLKEDESEPVDLKALLANMLPEYTPFSVGPPPSPLPEVTPIL